MTATLPLPTIARAVQQLAAILEGKAGAEPLARAAETLLPGTEALVLAYPRDRAPIHLFGTFAEPGARHAVQRYVRGTYVLNPVWNGIQSGLATGIYRIAELHPAYALRVPPGHPVDIDDNEEIGFRTPGWPKGRIEISMLSTLPGHVTGEVSLFCKADDGGFDETMIERLRTFKPLFDTAFQAFWTRHAASLGPGESRLLIDDFGRDRLSPREALIVQMILKGHSNTSISLTLSINVTTVKTHRKNAYAKLGISTQQELFNVFLQWLDAIRAAQGGAGRE